MKKVRVTTFPILCRLLSQNVPPLSGWLIFFLGCGLITGLYYLFVFGRFSWFYLEKPELLSKTCPPVSVIICARNEAKNLAERLPQILKQDYPNFEVVVCNDHSEDDTANVLAGLQRQFPRLRVCTTIQSTELSGKRAALKTAIDKSSHQILLLTDADCRPTSKDWISRMAAPFDQGADVVAGFSPYEIKPGLLNCVIRFETFFTALQYNAYTSLSLPYMAVGRNLAYRKALYLENKGWLSPKGLLSGDDDLFINRIASTVKLHCLTNPDSFTFSIPETTWKNWAKQKVRHTSAGHHYLAVHRLLLGAYLLANFCFYLFAPVVLLVNPAAWNWVLTAVLAKWTLQLFSFAPAVKKLDNTFSTLFIPVIDVLVTFGLVFTGLWSAIRKPVQWN